MESVQICRMLLQELRRHEMARCREHSQVISHRHTIVVIVILSKRRGAHKSILEQVGTFSSERIISKIKSEPLKNYTAISTQLSQDAKSSLTPFEWFYLPVICHSVSLSACGPARSGHGSQGRQRGAHPSCDPDRGVVQGKDGRWLLKLYVEEERFSSLKHFLSSVPVEAYRIIINFSRDRQGR